MKHYPKVKTLLEQPETKTPEILVSDISIQRLIDDSLLALYREVKNLLMLSAKGKLSSNDSRDLRDHLKLLFELKDREAASLAKLSDEELRKLADDNE